MRQSSLPSLVPTPKVKTTVTLNSYRDCQINQSIRKQNKQLQDNISKIKQRSVQINPDILKQKLNGQSIYYINELQTIPQTNLKRRKDYVLKVYRENIRIVSSLNKVTAHKDLDIVTEYKLKPSQSHNQLVSYKYIHERHPHNSMIRQLSPLKLTRSILTSPLKPFKINQ